MTHEIDSDSVFNAIVSLPDVSVSAKEVGAELADLWLREAVPYDRQFETLGVEVGFYVALDEYTFVVGAVDRIARDTSGVVLPVGTTFFQEHKTTAKQSSTWTPERWFDELARGPQLGTYGLALQHGIFLFPDGPRKLSVDAPSVLVRAVSKSRPPVLWPDAKGAFVTVSPERIVATRHAYQNAASQIRASQETGQFPLQLPGKQCLRFNKYRCRFWDTCHSYVSPQGYGPLGSTLSPGSSRVLDYLRVTNVLDVRDARNVILSASTLASWDGCGEEWRLAGLRVAPDETNEHLEVGKVLHHALETIYGGGK